MTEKILIEPIELIETFTDKTRHIYFNFGQISEDNDEKEPLSAFIKRNFHYVDCVHTRKLSDTNDFQIRRCLCGELKNYQDKTCDNELINKTCCMDISPHESFGKIEFVGEDVNNTKLTEFVRLSYHDDLDEVINLMFNYWNIDIGTLCISVIGGSKNFQMRTKEKHLFSQGLIRAVKTANATIITSGFNVGISRIVGDSIQDGQSSLYDKTRSNNFICCLGVSPWSSVKDNKILERAKGKIVQYKVQKETKSDNLLPLNKNHTHYLFLDDGIQSEFSNTKIAKFKAALLRKITQKTVERDSIPAVLLIVEGDHDVLVEASRSVEDNISIVIIEGTGKASDILAETLRKVSQMSLRLLNDDGVPMLPEPYRSNLKKKLVEINVSTTDQVNETILCIENIIHKEYLISVFDINEDQSLDNVIFHSLLKKIDFVHDPGDNPLYDQLHFCLKWNRVDIAKEKVFSKNVSFSPDEWTCFLKEVIIIGKVDFIKLFLQNGAVMQDLLTRSILKQLYEECPRAGHFRRTFTRLLKKNFSNGLSDVEILLNKIFGNFHDPCFVLDEEITHPFQELFIWSVFMEKHECAAFFWEKTEESLLLALIATKIYKTLSETTPLDTDRIQSLKQWKNYFEQLAIRLLEECYEDNQEATAYIIEKQNMTWGGQTCLELAYKANDLKFISCLVCQKSIDFMWRAGFNITIPQCFLCIFFPCLIFKQSFDKSITYGSDKDDIYAKENGLYVLENPMVKLKRFYLAPQTKFCVHTLTFLIFNMYFTYVILFGMKRLELTNDELTFSIYLVCMVIENSLEIFQSNFKRFEDKIKYWWNFNNWNKIDVLMIIFSIIGMLLRFRLLFRISDDDVVMIYKCCKTFYSMIIGYFYLKFLHFVSVNKDLGPKIYMISKMFQELILYLIIMLLIVLAFGITLQGSYYPQRDYSLDYLANIIDLQYWAIFGELSLDKLVYLRWCNESTNYNNSNTCPEENFFIPILFSIYVLFANTLMITLLIAVFNYIFQKIHKNSIEVWKFTMFSLVMEYDVKPIFPLPFSIFVYSYNILSRICQKMSGIDKENDKDLDQLWSSEKSKNYKSDLWRKSLIMPLESELDTLVKYFENNSQKSVVKELIDEREQSMESGVFRLESRLKTMSTIIKSIDAKVRSIEMMDSQVSMKNTETLTLQIEPSTEDHNFENNLATANTEVLELIQRLRERNSINYDTSNSNIENDQDMVYTNQRPKTLHDTSLKHVSSGGKVLQNRDLIAELHMVSEENKRNLRELNESFDAFKLEVEESLKRIMLSLKEKKR